jgi:hypothetical protein
VAAQSEKKRSRLGRADHVDVVQNVDGGVCSVLGGCRFEDGGVPGQESGQRRLWVFLALKRAPGAVAEDEPDVIGKRTAPDPHRIARSLFDVQRGARP